MPVFIPQTMPGEKQAKPFEKMPEMIPGVIPEYDTEMVPEEWIRKIA